MYSDEKLANCVRPEIQEVINVRGTNVQVQKLWKDYTDQEKANAINYKFGCGSDVVLFMLHLERELEELKQSILLITAKTDTMAVRTVNENFDKIDATITKIDESLKRIETEVARRATPEYVGQLEASMFDRTDQLSGDLASLTERVRAIETKPTQLEADAAAAALPAPYNSAE